MAGLLDIADVDVGDGRWMQNSSYPMNALACGRVFRVTDRCEPAVPPDEADDDALTGYDAVPFVVIGSQKFGVRCLPDIAQKELIQAVENASEYQVADVFWRGPDAVDLSTGTWAGDLYMESTEVDTVAVVDPLFPKITLSSVIKQAYANHPDMPTPILHLGLRSALEIGDDLWNLDLANVVVSPAYPADAIAITGPIQVRLSDVKDMSNTEWAVNRRFLEGYRFASVEFDPCLAVRAGS